MAKGDIAKKQIVEKIIEIFGQDKAFLADKKLYINTTENGQPIQVCIAMTCPKTMIEGTSVVAETKATVSNAFDSFAAAPSSAASYQPAEITPEERATVVDLMKKLGL